MSVVYRNCVVPNCRSSVQRTPDKLFIHVPLHQDVRNKWLELAGRKNEFSPKSPIYFCSDHFDLERDMENYMEYKVMGFVKKVKLIKECLPSKFDCQNESNKRTLNSIIKSTEKVSPEKIPRLSLESQAEETDALLPSSIMVQLPMVVEDEKNSTEDEIEEEPSPARTKKKLNHDSTPSNASTTSNQTNEHNPIHYLDFIPATNGKLKVTRQCIICKQNNIFKRTRFYCPTCPTQPALCIGICYKSHHETNHV